MKKKYSKPLLILIPLISLGQSNPDEPVSITLSVI